MAVVRILLDGSSILGQWTALAPGKPRDSEAARQALFARLIHTRIPISAVIAARIP